MLNSGRYLELYLAVGWAGAVIVPLNIRWSLVENRDALQDCGALCHAKLSQRACETAYALPDIGPGGFALALQNGDTLRINLKGPPQSVRDIHVSSPSHRCGAPSGPLFLCLSGQPGKPRRRAKPFPKGCVGR